MSNPARIYAFQNQAYFNRQPFPQPRREVRSKYASISTHQNFMDPFSIFQGFMSGALKEEDQNLFPAVSTFNYFKRISEVLHHKDRKVISAYLENDPIWSATTWAEVVESFGMEQAENMSKLIDTFGSKYLKSTGIKTDFEARKEDFDKLRAKYEREVPCFYIKNIIKRRNPTVVEYNTDFLTFLGYNPKEFASNILSHGIPEIYPNMQKKYAGMVKEVVEILLEGKQGIKPIVKQVYLLRADLQIVYVKETTYLMRSLNQNQELELELFFMYEKISEPMKVEEEFKALVQPKPRIAPQPTPVKMEQEQEKDEFLKKFYNIKKKDESDLARTCKIRYL